MSSGSFTSGVLLENKINFSITNQLTNTILFALSQSLQLAFLLRENDMLNTIIVADKNSPFSAVLRGCS